MPMLLVSLLAFAAWTVVLVLLVLSWRGIEVFLRGAAWNSFPGGFEHGPPLYWRINRAHANAVENLPLFFVVVFAALYTGATSPFVERMSVVVVAARVLQSIAHISSGSSLAVRFRFTFYFIQLVGMLSIAYAVVAKATR